MKEAEREDGVVAEDRRHGVDAAGDLPVGLCDALRVLDEKTVEDDLVVDDGKNLSDLLVVLLFHLRRGERAAPTSEKRDKQKS